MKKTLLLAIFAGLHSMGVHADYDPVLEAKEAAQRKAEQQRAAKQKAEHDKLIREGSAKAYRTALGKDAGIAAVNLFDRAGSSNLFGPIHPRRDVTPAMQHAPDVDVVAALDVEDEMRIVGKGPEAQARQV